MLFAYENGNILFGKGAQPNISKQSGNLIQVVNRNSVFYVRLIGINHLI